MLTTPATNRRPALYAFTPEELGDLLYATIDMFVEYRDVHGQPESKARYSAAAEVMGGTDALYEMAAHKECNLGKGAQQLEDLKNACAALIGRLEFVRSEEAKHYSTDDSFWLNEGKSALAHVGYVEEKNADD